jgi:hypothetical protein
MGRWQYFIITVNRLKSLNVKHHWDIQSADAVYAGERDMTKA